MQTDGSRYANKKDKNPYKDFDILMESSNRLVKKEQSNLTIDTEQGGTHEKQRKKHVPRTVSRLESNKIADTHETSDSASVIKSQMTGKEGNIGTNNPFKK